MPDNQTGESEKKDEHGCVVGKEKWNGEKCVPIEGDASNPNPTAKMSIDQALAENAALKTEVKDLKRTVGELAVQLKAANDVLEAQEKGKLIGEILPRSKFTIEDLAGKSLEELQRIRLTLDQAKLPTYKNIHLGSHLGPVGADEGRDDGLTVGDLSVVTEQKRKAAAGRA
ncbi:MAG: hypothetical protein OEY22_07155 [Candidatus Bathyarchaeota archaeon]|nr:hypothetical protein [Candidatus Bathyarchaeota archaeon]MDH5786762.1 hypothetical protein [Candidatus Bathyarchaeota archaeon]